MELFRLLGKIAVQNTDANNAIDETTDKAEKSQSKLSNVFSKIGNGALKLGKVAATGVAAATAAVVALTKSTVDGYADYEQLVGGVETLFSKSADIVKQYADNAYKTAGMSANAYMETVTSFSASLLQSLDNDTDKAAKKADLAITDMADNANKMGTAIESIQNAYQGFAKQNYTMLDNLKLGYGGTKEEMERLLADAEKLSGQKFDISSYADIVDAIHIVQTEMGITGTTAKEASETISGSVSSAKAAWNNLLVGIADDNQDFNALMDNFVNSVVTVGNNLIPRIQIIFGGIGKLINGFAEKLVPQVLGMIPSLVENILPKMLDAAGALVNGVTQVLPSIVVALVSIVPQFINTVMALIPQLITVGMDIIFALLDGITQTLPQLLVSLAAFIPQLCDKLVGYGPNLLNAAIQLLMAIVQAIPNVVDALAENLSDLIKTIIYGLINALPDLLQGAIEFFNAIVQALPIIVQKIGENLPWIIETIVQGLIDAIPELLNGALQLLNAIVEAIPLLIDALIPQIPGIVTTIVSGLVSMLPTLINGALKLFLGLITGLMQMLPSLVKALPSIVNALIVGLAGPVTGLFQGLWNGIKNIFAPMVSWFSDKFNSVKEKMIEPIEKARDTIKGIVDKIAGFFKNVDLSFSNIKLPHFSISPNGWKIEDLLQGSIPKLGIEWYEKAMDSGLIMDKPTIFGVSGNGNLMGGGEAGSETVVGTDSLMNMIQKAVDNAFVGNTKLLELILAELRQIDSTFADKFCKSLQSLGIKWDEREIARLIKKYA